MNRILGSWSGMRKYLEQDMLTECLKGRVRYNCTTYPGMDDCKIFEIFIDNKPIKRFSWETVNTYFINNDLTVASKNKPFLCTPEYWVGFHKTLNCFPMDSRTEYTDDEFCDALKQYRNQAIQDSIHSENPLIKMFAILDRRIGKRTLLSIKSDEDIQPEWLRYFYKLRFEAEML